MAASFNSSILPVPSLSFLSAYSADDLSKELCSDLDTSLIDDTAKALHRISSIAIDLMFLLLFLVWATLAIWEWRKWKLMKDTIHGIEQELHREGESDAWRMVAIVEHPVLERYSGTFLGKIAKTPRMRTNFRWFCKYHSFSNNCSTDSRQYLTSLIRLVLRSCSYHCSVSSPYNSS